MFLFRTEVKVATDPRMGLGLFTTEFIPKDSVVWEFIEGVDIKVSIDRVKQSLLGHKKNNNNHLLPMHIFQNTLVELTNFVNHSYKPNLKIIDEVVVALENIQPGEELFEDYSEFDDCFDEYKDMFYDTE